MSRNVPKLRFKGFEDEWKEKKISDTLKIRHGKDQKLVANDLGKYPILGTGGIIGKSNEFLYDKESVLIGRKGTIDRPFYMNTPFWTVDTLFYSEIKKGFCAKFLYYSFQRINWKKYSEASGVPSLSASTIESIKYILPELNEQEKIANFLSKVDSIIEKQEKKVQYWNSYKKGMIQKIFSQKIRFQDGNKKSYTDWEEVRLSYILTETNNKNTGDLRVCSVSVRKGVIDQIEHLGRSFAAKDTSKYKLVKKGDLIYTKSPTGEFPYGIIKQSFLEENVVVSPLYGVFKPKNYYLGYILHSYFYYKENTNNYLYSIVQKGAKNTINISNEVFLSKKLNLPTSTDEQIKIFNLLLSIDNIIDKENKKLEELKQWKKGLLQQMFV
ncbi:restriction endonuclease subunit S [Clostridium perfringens]|uniref:restriction endonuclease subunit S n=1 Tax=Clostridium perfringens TaxID=1502 RepID=UPI002444871C|nr:restriction endonuclease subunit S [Clostridium perfringens]MDG6891970.1 Type I restriction modification DNA specificity domain protein [Clostridium perfringens]